MIISDYEQGSREHIVTIDPTTGRYLPGMRPESVLPPLVKLHESGTNAAPRWLDPEGHTWEPIKGDPVRWQHASNCICGVRRYTFGDHHARGA